MKKTLYIELLEKLDANEMLNAYDISQFMNANFDKPTYTTNNDDKKHNWLGCEKRK